ncbi:hypothetical protein R3X27_10505 [Tropicimonas sp. TH_r6]|uniref:hypothetical protein n=1 Tax=Tropicimonas sp. TH_r6 TaxID=3082085 RepID=UPI00295357C1|nr:hypothetical protein [Tropicimonas sp. TH_r6]MDV7143114.1 hypothetical protein [Tropicimonas sp. TH_r6]
MTEQSIDPDRILATISPSAPRRMMGIIVLCTLGVAVLYLAIAKPPAELHWRVFLLILGAGTLYLSESLRRNTEHGLELTSEVLRESGGRVVARVDSIIRVERGTFAVKPSNGFLLQLSEPEAGNRWAPGLYWRLGRRIGVGGITAAHETKAVAEILAALIAARAVAALEESAAQD